MPPETLDSLDKDSLKSLVLQLLAQNNELLQQIKTLLARMGVHGGVQPHELTPVAERLKRLPPPQAPERKWKKARPQQHHAGARQRFPARRAR